MNNFNGKWKDPSGLVITIEQGENIITALSYDNGRGPFQGFQTGFRVPVINVNFSDGVLPDSGSLAGVLNLSGEKIFWCNDTVWTKINDQ